MIRPSAKRTAWGDQLVAGMTPEQRARLVDPLAEKPPMTIARVTVPADRPTPVRLPPVGVVLTIRFVVEGAPRCKNTGKSPRPGVVIPSAPFRRWLASAKEQAHAIRAHLAMRGVRTPIFDPVDVTAVFYRDRAVGDEDRYMVAFGDFLQGAGLIDNDSAIHWTGDTRREIDRDRPRVECVITTRSGS